MSPRLTRPKRKPGFNTVLRSTSDQQGQSLQRRASNGGLLSGFASLSLQLPGWLPNLGSKPGPGQGQNGSRKPEERTTAPERQNLNPFAAISFGDWKKPDWPQPRWPQWPTPLWVVLSPPGHPDKKRLMTVQDFYKYTEEEGRAFFDKLDRDGDGRVSLDDMKHAMRGRNLPEGYAKDFIKTARGNRWWANSVGWEEFRALVDEKEPHMLRAFTSMEVDTAGQLKREQIKGTLHKIGVEASDANAKAMIKALGVEEDGFVSYGNFRNFLLLLPPAKLTAVDPSVVWFESATMVPLGPPGEHGTGRVLLRAALAGGIASGSSTLLLHPLDTCKTRVQSTPGASIASIARSVPSIGARGLYRGILPAASGSFVSHGLRTCAYEATFRLLLAASGGRYELQIQAVASGVGTLLGTCIRIPCEVMKQRLQVGRHDNVIQAARAATAVEGTRGLFRGTVATLSREVPFYVFGMVGYEQLKRLANGEAFGQKRELQPWQTIALGGLAGALASVMTMPADVMKTRIMTAAADQSISTGAIFMGILRNEGVGAFFKGALPRALWIAPLGAMNFAGYELAKKALDKADKEHQLQQQQQQQEQQQQLAPTG